MPPKDKKLNYKQRQSLTFIQQSDPPFVKKIKEKLGYRESKVEDKVCTY
jgi:DNA-binding MarR family transcriptional regulator